MFVKNKDSFYRNLFQTKQPQNFASYDARHKPEIPITNSNLPARLSSSTTRSRFLSLSAFTATIDSFYAPRGFSAPYEKIFDNG